MTAIATSKQPLRVNRTRGVRKSAVRARVAVAITRAATVLTWSPVLRWRYMRAAADPIVLEPRDLRVADPAFATEFLRGVMGLAGHAVVVGDGDPFGVPPPSLAWHDELHGFGWLRGVAASGNPDACDKALAVIELWIARYADDLRAPVWRPGVAARRVLSWLCNVGPIQEQAGRDVEERIHRSLSRHLVALAASWRVGRDGPDRLLAALARVAGDVCVEGRERQFLRSARDLGRELDRQILPDGGHLSRNPDAVVDILLDLLPIQHCIVARGLDVPISVERAVARMMKMIRHLRIGGGELAAFNGGGRLGIERLASVLAHDPDPDAHLMTAEQSGYVRLERGRICAVADVGAPPPVLFATAAQAGTLAIEVAVDGRPVMANAGWPSRDTASHSTLVIADTSSASLLRDPTVADVSGGIPLVQSGRVSYVPLGGDEDLVAFEASHEGYVDAFGLVHRRRLRIEESGAALSGVDCIEGPRRTAVRLKRDLPFAIRFHLTSDVSVAGGPWPDAVDLTLPSGDIWRFSTTGAVLTLEESRRHDRSGAIVPGIQIVLRGVTFGESEVAWRFAALEPDRHA